MKKLPGRLTRIGIIIYSYPPARHMGGPPMSNQVLAEALGKRGAVVEVITSDYDGRKRTAFGGRSVAMCGVNVHYSRWPRGRWWPIAPDLCRSTFARIQGCDVVLITVSWSLYSLIITWICRVRRVPYIAYPRGSFDPRSIHKGRWKKKLFWWLCGRAMFRKAAGIVALNEDERYYLERAGLQGAVRVIPNAVSPPVRKYSREGLWGALPAIGDRPYFLFMGRLERAKGIDLLIEAFAEARMGNKWCLVAAGSGDEKYIGRLKQRVAELRLERRVFFPGIVAAKGKAAALANCECFVLPSQGEGMPMSVLEAMSFGKPVIITKACHMPEVKIAGAGLIVESSINELRIALERMMMEPDLRSDCGRCAASLVRERFSPERVAEATIIMIDQIKTEGLKSRENRD